ncbi:hypothetical protein HYY69_01190 [Candidatus Woesearchaeota archaeon]|nr:hypothetical protein [Candidatus Woesearchaeota archaeon]
MDPILFVGLSGMSLILLAFIMNQFHKWHDDDLIYDIVNVLGSGLLFMYAYLLNSMPFMVLNAVWFLISLRDIFLDVKVMQRNKLTLHKKVKI